MLQLEYFNYIYMIIYSTFKSIIMKKFTSTLLIVLFGLGLWAQNSQLTSATASGNESGESALTNTTVTVSTYLDESDKSTNSTIDQDQPLDNTYMAGFSQGGLAQSFIPAANDICGAGVAVFSPSGTSYTADITISLWDNLPNAGGTQLATGTVNGTFDGTPLYADVSWPTLAITPGTTYYLVFTSSDNSLGLRGHTGNPYPFGMVFANSYNPFSGYDYTFHTYTCGTPVIPMNNWAIILSILLIGGFVTFYYRRKLA